MKIKDRISHRIRLALKLTMKSRMTSDPPASTSRVFHHALFLSFSFVRQSLGTYPRLALSFQLFCLSLPSTGVVGERWGYGCVLDTCLASIT